MTLTPLLQPGDRTSELAAIVALMRSQVLPVDSIAGWIEHFGSAARLVIAAGEDKLPVGGELGLIGAVTEEVLSTAWAEVEEWLATGYDVRTVLDSTYPSNLLEVYNRPPLIFVRGHWDDRADARSVAIVGTRTASQEGIRRAGQLSRDFAEAGFTVLSGLARGVDAAAHATALKFGGRTAAVMGTGIDRIYPTENEKLAVAILDSGGALLSQFFPRQPPTQWTFPKRNVVMSGLALATIVVEAAFTSGARMQARVALQHGRTVFLVESLLRTHDWARKYAEEGVAGSRAIPVGSSQQILDRLSGSFAGPQIVFG